MFLKKSLDLRFALYSYLSDYNQNRVLTTAILKRHLFISFGDETSGLHDLTNTPS
jgi:hypothetical protein